MKAVLAVNPEKRNTLELEARLGVWRPLSKLETAERNRRGERRKNAHFFPNTTRSFFEEMRAALHGYTGWRDEHGAAARVQEHVTYDCFFRVANKRVRAEMSGVTRKMRSAINKTRMENFDYKIAGSYDIRVSLSDERPVRKETAEEIKRAAEDLLSPMPPWALLSRGCELRLKSQLELLPIAQQGCDEADVLLRWLQNHGSHSKIRSSALLLPLEISRNIRWTLEDIDYTLDLQGKPKEFRKRADEPSSTDMLTVTCLPGCIKAPIGHSFPIFAYRGRVERRNVEPVFNVKGVSEKNAIHNAIEYRKKRRTTFPLGEGLQVDLTISQHSERSIQDTETALEHFEIELELDFSKLHSRNRDQKELRRVVQEFVKALQCVLFSCSVDQ